MFRNEYGEARKHECPCCECGKVEYTWSDRRMTVFPDDNEALANVVLACALDHSYDRHDGVPYGFTGPLREKLLAVVARHLSAKNPDWLNHSVIMTDEERAVFLADVVAVFAET